MYMFDDKAHVAMYPFIEPSEAASAVYTYPRSSKEYDRLNMEFEMLWHYSQNTARLDTPSAQSESSNPKG